VQDRAPVTRLNPGSDGSTAAPLHGSPWQLAQFAVTDVVPLFDDRLELD
jgi:hypothetical protein